MVDIKMPDLPGGAAAVWQWLVAPGATVVAGAPLAIVLTERAEVVLPAAAGGVLSEPVAVGTLVERGGLLARLAREPADAKQGAAAAALTPVPAPAPEDRSGPGAAQRREHRARARPVPRFVTPLARRIAAAHGLDLAAVGGTGPGGRIGAADVRVLLDAPPGPQARPPTHGRPPPSAPPVAPWPMPVATATVELDAGAALAAAGAACSPPGRARLPVGLTALVVGAAAALLPTYGELNGAWGGEVAVLRRRVHIAVAEAAPAGARWAVVRDAGDLTPRGVARALAGGDGAGGEATFAVVSLAEGVGWQSAAPPLPGTAAALSVGAPARRAVLHGEAVAVRLMATLTLAYDARLIDHGRAAAFLASLRAQLEGC